MSSNRDAQTPHRHFLRMSNACLKHKHWLCSFLVSCPCRCHVEDARELVDKLLQECDQRAGVIDEAS
jgi:hypothetical protein